MTKSLSQPMNTSLAHLTLVQRQDLETAKRIIVQVVRPEKILLFGVWNGEADARSFSESLLGGNGSGGIGRGGIGPGGIGAFDLLVVTRCGDRHSDYEQQDIIENACRGQVVVTALVHDIGYVNRRIAEGQTFFSQIRREAVLLYDSGGAPLSKAGECDLAQVLQTAERDFDRWRRQSRAFFRSAEFNLGAGEWKVVLFMLHQAAEQIYQAILLAFMGYKPTTHNLDKLRRYTNRYSIELAWLFPRDNDEEDRLFRLLLSGYVDARYKEDFVVGEADARLLAMRVGRLLEVADRICGNRLLSLSKQAAQS